MSREQQKTRNRSLIVALASAVLMVGTLTWAVRAQRGAANNGTPEVITYRGYLEDSSTGTAAPVNNPAQAMTFSIWDGPSPSATKLWECVGMTVPVVGGHFEAQLGVAPCTFSALLFNNPTRYLEVTIGASVLAGRQRITSAPYAIGASQANNFLVQGTLTVQGTSSFQGVTATTLMASGAVSVQSLSATNAISTSGSVSAGTLTATEATITNGSVSGTLSLGANGHITGLRYQEIQIPAAASSVQLTSGATTFCSLGTVANTGSGTPTCSIWRDGTTWRANSSVNANCWAICLTF